MLKKIRLTDFKSFVDEEVELAPLTLLVGANASGKSNFLDAIRFLHGLSWNLTLSEILNGEERVGADRWPGIRGRAEETARESAVRQGEVQVIATTHSPVVLQWLSQERLRDTLVFGRVPEHQGTIVRPLGKLPYFEEVIQRKGIEELFSTGWLKMAL